ncbi:MAG: class IV adenylate cyclase [Candidatus Heimdallarchaeota archaeon]|nr:MAG: class IV adenylate cyclase [Candidatus Heimdallarchaeota archaeon]
MEIEMKIPLKANNSIDKLVTLFSRKFGAHSEEITQIDTYFTSPIHNFMKSDEALRLRQILTKSGEEKIEITYKGPKQGKTMKIREEITIEASNIINAKRILQNLGFQIFTKIEKKRMNWSQDNIIISFDRVQGLGPFLEIETMTTSKHSEEITKRKEKIIQIVKEIIPNWSGEDERKSYLELLIEKQLNTKGT